MRIRNRMLVMASAAALMTSLAPLSVHAATTFSMRQTKVELNGKVLSTPSAFTYHNTTYMPLYYVQQLLDQLQIENTWKGTVSAWNITTPFPNQPTFTQTTKTGPMSVIVNQKTVYKHVDKVVAVDPSSKKDTTFIPIWYIQQTLKAMGMDSTWKHDTWNATVSYADNSKSGKRLGWFSTLSDAETALLDYPGGTVKDATGNTLFTEDSFKNVDLRYPAPANINAASLNQYLADHSVIMAGLGQTFIDAQTTYGVNANYLVSHAIEETGSSGSFSTISENKNNLYGYGAFDANAGADAGTFPSMAYAILFQAWEVRNNYLNPQSSHYETPTLSGIAQNYASDTNWANKVNDLMDQLAIDMKDNVTSYAQYSAANNPTPPAGSSAIPVYYLSGAKGTVQSDTYYGTSVPVYQNGGVGHQYMFARELKLGDQGDDVQTLQEALNQLENAGLKTDGAFGAKTETALKQFQSLHGLQPTGVCDFNLWNNVLGLNKELTTVSAGQQIQIDQIVEGMAGGHVTEWYHIPNGGWVNADDVALDNVYKVTVPSLQNAADAEVTVKDATGSSAGTLHVGDYVVSDNPTAISGEIAVSVSSQADPSGSTGFIDAASAGLQKVTR